MLGTQKSELHPNGLKFTFKKLLNYFFEKICIFEYIDNFVTNNNE
jgi:hypothetical protein